MASGGFSSSRSHGTRSGCACGGSPADVGSPHPPLFDIFELCGPLALIPSPGLGQQRACVCRCRCQWCMWAPPFCEILRRSEILVLVDHIA